MASTAPLLPMTGKQAEAGGKAGDPEKKKSKMKLFVIIGLVLLLGGAGAYETVLKPAPTKAAKGAKGAVTKPKGPKLTGGATISLTPVTTSISDGHVIQIGLGLQVVTGASTDLITTEAPQADDAALTVLAGYTSKELLSPTGRAKAHKAIKAAVIKEVVDGKGKQQIFDVFLQTYVVQ